MSYNDTSQNRARIFYGLPILEWPGIGTEYPKCGHAMSIS